MVKIYVSLANKVVYLLMISDHQNNGYLHDKFLMLAIESFEIPAAVYTRKNRLIVSTHCL